MSAADILRQAGFVPIVPEASRLTGTPADLTPQRVPIVPPVPVQKHKGEAATASRNMPVLSPEQMATLESMAADTAERMAGRAPKGDTGAMICRHCGPVFVHPSIAGVLPVVDGWPRALGCMWCAIRKARKYVPRPPVACAQCVHYRPDEINAVSGLGDCTRGHGMHYPTARHRCSTFVPRVKP